jgi:tetratricopeptide (TPR) repeat protein
VAILNNRKSKQHLSKKRKSRNPNFENSALKLTEMKKIFLLPILLFQLTIVFGQTPIAEDEKVIQYSTNWGAWVAAAGNNNILFSARLKWYDKKTKLYAWDVRHKVLKMPIAFEWKISNQVFTGASDYDETVEENDGYYKTSVFDTKDNSNSMNGGGFGIYSTSKTTLYYQVRNVCFEFDGRNPNCEIIKSTNITKKNNKNEISNSSKKSDEIILENIKSFLKEEIHLIYSGLTINIQNVAIENNNLVFSTEVIDKMPQYPCPSSKTYFTYSVPINDIILEKIDKEVYGVGNQKVLNVRANQNLKVQGKKYRQNPSECSPLTEDKGYAENKIVSEYQFEYNFGTNDENFIELKNAIEALKNPNKSLAGNNSKQSSNVKKTEVVEKTKNENNLLSEQKINEQITNNYNLGLNAFNEKKYKEAEVYFQKVLDNNPNDKNSYSNLIAVKFELEREIVEFANKNSSNEIIYNKQLKTRSKILEETKSLLEKYLLLDNTNQDFKNTLDEVNKILLKNYSISSKPNYITPKDLLNNLEKKTADKLTIFKNYFIQEGYQFIGEGECKSFFDGVLKCLKFSNFSIYQNKKGMLGISFGDNSISMKEIKNKLSAIGSTFIENEFHDKGKLIECDITFNQGKLLFYMN